MRYTAYQLYQTIRDNDGEEIDASRWECTDLRGAIQELQTTRTAHVDGTLLLTVQNAMEYRTGHREERMLAVFCVTHSTARRLARLLNAEWNA